VKWNEILIALSEKIKYVNLEDLKQEINQVFMKKIKETAKILKELGEKIKMAAEKYIEMAEKIAHNDKINMKIIK
jgi:hypothetical protein